MAEVSRGLPPNMSVREEDAFVSHRGPVSIRLASMSAAAAFVDITRATRSRDRREARQIARRSFRPRSAVSIASWAVRDNDPRPIHAGGRPADVAMAHANRPRPVVLREGAFVAVRQSSPNRCRPPVQPIATVKVALAFGGRNTEIRESSDICSRRSMNSRVFRILLHEDGDGRGPAPVRRPQRSRTKVGIGGRQRTSNMRSRPSSGNAVFEAEN